MMMYTLVVVQAQGWTEFTNKSPHQKLSENKKHKVDKTDTDDVPLTVDIKYTQDYELKPGQYLEPVIFEPMKKIRLSRSTYKVSSFVDFRPYYRTFKAYGHYLLQFKQDLNDPQHIGSLYNLNRTKSDHWEGSKVNLFAGSPCKIKSYECRLMKQFKMIKKEVNNLETLYNTVFAKFLSAIDHLDYHSTLGKKKNKDKVEITHSERFLQTGTYELK